MNRLLLFILFFSCLLLSKGSATSNQQNIEKGGFMESSSSQVTKTTYKTWGDKFAESFYLCIIGNLNLKTIKEIYI